MSRSQTMFLSKEIAKANQGLSWATQVFNATRTIEDLIRLVEAQGYLSGLCKAMSHASEQASVNMKGGWKEKLATATEEVK